MNVASPYADLLPGARGKILATLAQLEQRVTVRELARHAGTSPQAALDVVNDLAEVGLVDIEVAGRSLMVGINREHLLAEPLLVALDTRRRLVDGLIRELSSWQELAGAWLFGSAARGDGTRRSDIDLLVVAAESVASSGWSAACGQLAERVRAWTGNALQFVEHDRSSLAELVRDDNPLISAVRSEGIELVPGSRSLLRRIA